MEPQEKSYRFELVRRYAIVTASAVEEQSAAISEVSRNVEEAAAGTQQVSDNIDGVSEECRSKPAGGQLGSESIWSAAAGRYRSSPRPMSGAKLLERLGADLSP